MAFWLVIGTPASSIVYASGQLDAKDFIRMATITWPIALVVMVIMVIVYWVGVLGLEVLTGG
jgi:di/tricarboxylate transporter